MAQIVEFPVQLPMNMEQAKSLFWKESIILGPSGGVPVSRVEELLGKEAAEFLFRGDREKVYGTYANIYTIGDFYCPFLYLEGFLKAVTYANVQWFSQQETIGADVGEEREGDNELMPHRRRRRAAL